MIRFAPDRKILDEMMRIAESIYGTASDPEQIPITQEAWEKIAHIDPHATPYELDTDGNLIAWAVTIPTTKTLMRRFLAKEINEKQLFEATPAEGPFDALYLCSVIVLSEYRRKGLATKLLTDAVQKVALVDGAEFFTWPTTKEGKNLAQSLNDRFGKIVRVREP